ncbi:DNA methyltransferase [Leptospira yasudae]|uniref:site-specific DNA-methyltransferase (cytosine-N(4)-specific) n=2 Tax=Leptospira yasudae TaxID=2202201 RepID=A0A5F2B6A6_9LEPT|nr:hypothetical protein EHQ72_14580 [Leptospira yasudae]TGL79722.1 hypothetical protein EHQ83_17770 [Leptospira yasudae]TGL80122.1 hypothetical protein EHQ77_09095 [Leptospira yasudae]TGM01038.1 hypothetical protein EHQ86_18610 [Leptospira yasudae]
MYYNLNTEFSLRDSGYSNYEDTTSMPRHRWYYYKEGFSPRLVESAIEQSYITKKDLIIDPFNGSGTTTLTCSTNGFRSIGLEVNPFTSFLSDVKIKNAKVKDIRNWKSKLFKSVEKGGISPLLGYSTFSKRKNLSKWLFNDSVLNSFEGGWRLANSIPAYNVRKLFKLSLIASAMQNCNATRDGKCLRYNDNWWKKRFNKISFLESLDTSLNHIEEDILRKPILKPGTIINGDSRLTLSKLNGFDRFKLCITSPPYLNTFDYTDIYRPELFLGQFVNQTAGLQGLRLSTIRSHIQVKWEKPKVNDFGLLYQQTIQYLQNSRENLMHKDIPTMAQAYFEDMYNIFKLLKTKAAPNAYIWFVVSNSAYAGHELPVDLILGDIGSKAGWYLKEIGVLRYLKKRKTKYSANVHELRESVIIFSNRKF